VTTAAGPTGGTTTRTASQRGSQAAGFPVVDAAMRQLTSEGFMPGRARMIVASLLTKALSIEELDGLSPAQTHDPPGDPCTAASRSPIVDACVASRA
jgi:FAD binding domain of DNA photolyase